LFGKFRRLDGLPGSEEGAMIYSRCNGAVTAAVTAFAAVRVGHSIRRVAVLAALSFGAVHGNALAASDVADAAMRNDATRVVKLIAAKADENAPQPDGSTALHWAAYHGDVKLTGALLRAHANPGVVMENGMTPLSLACENGN